MTNCTSCGSRLMETDRFCTECGSPVMSESESDTGQNVEKAVKSSAKLDSGTYTYPDGTTYEGEWKDEKRHGRGIWIRSDGMKYEGEWKNDKPNGLGTLTTPKGEKRTGEWKDGKFVAERKPIIEDVYCQQAPEKEDRYQEKQKHPENHTNPDNKKEKASFIIGVVAICFAAVAAAWSFIGGACCGWGGWGFAFIGFVLAVVSLVFKKSSLGWWALVLSIFAVVWVFLPFILAAIGISLDGFN